MSCPILTEDDVDRLLTMREAVRRVEQALRAGAEGGVESFPRFHLPANGGSLAITPGAERGSEPIVGFQVSFWAPRLGTIIPGYNHLAVVFDAASGALKGVVLGSALVALRVGAAGGVAIKYLARRDAKCLGVLGTGVQARAAVEAAAAVRQFELAKVYSPTSSHREDFVSQLGPRLGLRMQAAASSEEVVREADVLVCCTISTRPVFDAVWLKPGTHVSSIGPKYQSGHELPMEAVDRSAVIVAAPVAQIDSEFGHFGRHFLADTAHRKRLVELYDLVAGKAQGRRSEEDVTLFLSANISATEIILADEAIRQASLPA